MSDDPWDAIVLAGGRATRLGGAAKADLVVDGRTLLERTLDAIGGATRVVVVGDVEAPGAIVVQEKPRFGGPAAAIGAGLEEIRSSWVLVAACDHPFVADAVRPLLAARPKKDGTADGTTDGVVAVDTSGRRQHLLCLVRTSALRTAVAAQPSLTDLAVHRLVAPLDLAEVPLPPRATQDVDTWHDRDVAEGHFDD